MRQLRIFSSAVDSILELISKEFLYCVIRKEENKKENKIAGTWTRFWFCTKDLRIRKVNKISR